MCNVRMMVRVLGLVAASVAVSPVALAEIKIGVVSIPQLIEESPQAKVAMQALEDEFKPRQREIVNQQKELKAREEKFTRDSTVMSETERSRAEKDLRDSQRELARRQNEFVEDLNVRRNEELGRLQKSLLAEVQTYARAQGYDLVVGDGVLFARDTINITPAVLGAMKAKAPTAAPAAAQKPPEKKP